MFIVFLRFSTNKAAANKYLAAHKEWIKRGINDGVFLLVGGLQDDTGGCILAHNTTANLLEKRLSEDPFVKEGVVAAERFGIEPSMAEARLEFLKNS